MRRPTWDEVAVVLALVLAGAGFLFGGPLLGVLLLAVALVLAIVLWTPVRGWVERWFHTPEKGLGDTADEAQPNRLQRELQRQMSDVLNASLDRSAADRLNPWLETALAQKFPALPEQLGRLYQSGYEARALSLHIRSIIERWSEMSWTGLGLSPAPGSWVAFSPEPT